MMILRSAEKHKDLGLLVLRVGIGAMFIVHGLPKITAGPDGWVHLGGAMKNLGIDFAPTFWGFMAAFAEFGGGILIALGLALRPAAAMLVFNMIVAVAMHLQKGDDFNTWSHAAEDCVVFVALLLTGPGKYSLDELIGRRFSR